MIIPDRIYILFLRSWNFFRLATFPNFFSSNILTSDGCPFSGCLIHDLFFHHLQIKISDNRIILVFQFDITKSNKRLAS